MAEVCARAAVESRVMWAWRDSLDLGYEMVGSLNLVPAGHREDPFRSLIRRWGRGALRHAGAALPKLAF